MNITREAKGWTVGFEIESVVSAESERTVCFALAMLTEILAECRNFSTACNQSLMGLIA